MHGNNKMIYLLFGLEELLKMTQYVTQYVTTRQDTNETAYNYTIKMCDEMDLIIYV